MKDFLNGIGSFFSWFFKRRPTRREAWRIEEEKLKRKYDELIKKPRTAANIRRLDHIGKRLREIYKAALAAGD